MTVATVWTWAWQWWGILVTFNIFQFIIGIYLFKQPIKDKNIEDLKYVKTMKIMGMIFVTVALYRSIFVSSYLRQLAWFDSPLNSSLLIRFFAIFAELSFAGLIVKSLLRLNKDIPELITSKSSLVSHLQQWSPHALFISILLANVFATAATITKIDLLFAIEETFWGFGFLSIMPMLIITWIRLFPYHNHELWQSIKLLKIALIIISIFTIGYGIFEIGFNLPLICWPNAIAQLQMSSPDPAYQFGYQAIHKAFFIVNETKDLSAWGGMGFIVWHSGYFTICVWIVLYLMTGPRKKNNIN